MRDAKATWKGPLARMGWPITLLFVFLGALLRHGLTAQASSAVAGFLHRVSYSLTMASYFAFPLLPLLLLGRRPDDRWRPPGHLLRPERLRQPDRWRRWMTIVALEIPLLLVWGFAGASPGEYLFSGAYFFPAASTCRASRSAWPSSSWRSPPSSSCPSP